ncbi:MAG TPA: M15 family metallopeptidase [Candidatus Limnocylindria bacterium]|nr:M15 family metallopeptidase [Candidatus Limnocylindria bacterium]
MRGANTIPTRAHRAVLALLFATIVIGLADVPSPAPARAAGIRVTFTAGCHTGYRFASSGAVLARKQACLGRGSSAPASARVWVGGRGAHFAITAGIWAGYSIPETPRSYVPGIIVTRTFAPPERRSFMTGLYRGYAFDVAWTAATLVRSMWINGLSGANVSRHAVINGRYHYLMANGALAGLWVRSNGYHSSSPQMQYGPNPPACAYADVLTARRRLADWRTTLLDTRLMLERSYRPSDLVNTSTVGGTAGFSVRSVAATDLRTLLWAARSVGRPLRIISAYRSYEAQISVFNDWVAKAGYEAALRGSARPGHSEHQLGTTLDVTHLGGAVPWSYTDWAAHPTGAWLRDNAWRYGFVMSYPKGAFARSCYDYEPWHYRYVGRTMAAQVRESGLTLREWLWRRYGS